MCISLKNFPMIFNFLGSEPSKKGGGFLDDVVNAPSQVFKALENAAGYGVLAGIIYTVAKEALGVTALSLAKNALIGGVIGFTATLSTVGLVMFVAGIFARCFGK